MKHIKSLSIRTKLTLIVMATTFVALFLSLLALMVFDQLTFREWMRNHLQTRAEIIANNSTAALSFGDPQPAEELIKALSTDPHLGAAVVFDAHGKVFAHYTRPDWNVPLPSSQSGDFAVYHGEYLEVSRRVWMNGKRLGTLVLQTDLGELRERRDLGLLASFIVLLVAAGAGFLLAMRLQHFISRPILQLSQTARAVAIEKDYSVRVAKHTDDELGQLIDGFNEMLAQIETRDAALREAQGELERRVVLRTSELFEANEHLTAEVDAHKRARDESDALRQKLQKAYDHLQREAEDRAQVQEALGRSEERFSKAFRASPIPLAILTRATRAFVDVNDRFAELAGRDRDAIIGNTIFNIPLWAAPETRARLEQLLADGQPLRNWECRIAGANAQTHAALLSAESVMLGSEPCVLLMTEDISQRVNLEAQLRQAQKMDAIGQLASGVAHDFNNILTIIQGYTQIVIAMEPDNRQVCDALGKVVSASQRAAQLTRQLLTFSRKQIAQPKALDLNQVVTNVTAMLRPLLGEQVRLQWQPAAALPSIEGDAGMLEQVLVNLAVNARDAMPNGGDLIITTFTCEVDASYLQYRPQASAGRFICLQVSDSGCGMDAATLDRLFEPFFTTKGVGKGTGLGLATAYGIVKQHRGWIEVASQVGVGTTFKVLLPAAQSPASPAEGGGVAASVRGGHELILVVEDEPVLREMVIKILRNFGYQTLEATHGKEALTVWQTAPRKPSLLLTDMMMPEGMNGWELAERLRTDAPGLKVVYTSGYSPELFSGSMPARERANFLPKPFHPRILARTVRQCLDN
ncbi:MAG: ATP-binding protein [Verrucomicrobia bacterium]|jgi:PAS domain S-box-containing protein|nr:ATP-binding protein [Verrucomicrobiota bacterium]